MISASEARNKTNLTHKQMIDSKLVNIEIEIKKAIAKGENFCYYYDIMSNDMRLRLSGLGYNVKSYPQYNETSYKISWE